MGGFSRGSSAVADNEAEVENLLSQFEEESILKLSVNSHRRTEGFQAPSASRHDPAEPGLEENLLVRFANLKSRPAAPVTKSQDLSGVNAKNQASKEPDPDDDEQDREEEEEEADVLAAELEERLSSLKAGLYPSGKGKSSASSKAPSSKFSSSSTTSSDHSSSPSATPKSRSFSPIKFVKQLSMGKKNNSKAKSRSSEGSISSAEDDSMSDANKLLASVADQVMHEKRTKQNKLEDPTINSCFFAEEEDDEDDERLLKDLNLKQLKKELSKASGEEDRLTREAQQVIEWAKDAARLEAGSVVGDESDLEELLRMEDEEEEAMKKKKKGMKKWSLF